MSDWQPRNRRRGPVNQYKKPRSSFKRDEQNHNLIYKGSQDVRVQQPNPQPPGAAAQKDNSGMHKDTPQLPQQGKNSPFRLPRINWPQEYRRDERYFKDLLRRDSNNFVARHIYTRWLMTRRDAVNSIIHSDYLLETMYTYESRYGLDARDLQTKHTLLSNECEAYWECGKQNKKQWNTVLNFISTLVAQSRANPAMFPGRSTQFIHRLYFDSLRRIKPQRALTEITAYLDDISTRRVEFDSPKLWQLKGFIMDVLRHSKSEILKCYDESMKLYNRFRRQNAQRNDPHGWLECEVHVGLVRQVCVWKWNVPDAQYLERCVAYLDTWWRTSQHVDPECQVLAADYYYTRYLQSLDENNGENSRNWLRYADTCLKPNFLPKRKYDKVPQEITAPHVSTELRTYFDKKFAASFGVKPKPFGQNRIDIAMDMQQEQREEKEVMIRHQRHQEEVKEVAGPGNAGDDDDDDDDEKMNVLPLTANNLQRIIKDKDGEASLAGEPSIMSSIGDTVYSQIEGKYTDY